MEQPFQKWWAPIHFGISLLTMKALLTFPQFFMKFSPTVAQSMLCAQLCPFVRNCGLWRKLDTWDEVIAINSSLLVCSQDENRKKNRGKQRRVPWTLSMKTYETDNSTTLESKTLTGKIVENFKVWRRVQSQNCRFEGKVWVLRRFGYKVIEIWKQSNYGNSPEDISHLHMIPF